MLLPFAEHAEIDSRKLTEYRLSPDHPVGRFKARLFEAVLGMTADQAPELEAIIRRGILASPAVVGCSDEFGLRYHVDIDIVTPTGSAVVRTAWIIRRHELHPRLVSCYIWG